MPRRIPPPQWEEHKELYSRFLEIIEYEVKKGTKSHYKRAVSEFLRWCEEHGIKIDYTVPPELLYSYIDQFLKDTRPKNLSIKNKDEDYKYSSSYLTILASGILMFLNKVLKKSMTIKSIFYPKKPSEFVPTILTQEEVNRIYKAAENLPLTEQCMIRLGYEACLRSSELVILRVSNFDFENNQLLAPVMKMKLKSADRIKIKRVPVVGDMLPAISPKTWNLIEELIEEESHNKKWKDFYVFQKSLKKKNKYGVTRRRWLDGEWSKWFGDFTEQVLGKRVRFHDFSRHTRLTLLAESGASFEDLLLLSGHATPKRCLRYFEMARSGIAKKRLESIRKLLE